MKEALLEAEVSKLRVELQKALVEKDDLQTQLDQIKSASLSIDTQSHDPTILNLREDTPFFSPAIDKWNNSLLETSSDVYASELKLMDACRRGDADSIIAILSTNKRLVNMREAESSGLSPLHMSCSYASTGDVRIVSLLVETFDADLNVYDDSGCNPLHYACANGYLEIIQKIIRDYNAPVELLDREGKTPLFYAAYNGHLSAVELLVNEFGADPRHQNPRQWTALHCAALKGHSDVLSLLVKQYNVDVNACNYMGKTPLHYAVEFGHVEAVAVLVEICQANINQVDVTRSSALHYACRLGNVPITAVLLRSCRNEGATPIDCNLVNNFGVTPFFYAAGHLNVDLLKLLVIFGDVNIDASNVDGFTALQLACMLGHVASVRYLLEEGADIGQQNEDGYSAFHHAFYNGHVFILYLLIRKRLAQLFSPTFLLPILLIVAIAAVFLAVLWE